MVNQGLPEIQRLVSARSTALGPRDLMPKEGPFSAQKLEDQAIKKQQKFSQSGR